ncbi:Hypothetical protein CINCED_3A016271 [Cinara cedri]|uniref:Uncharacterized protein n=1 Tax=Cinara cedri TaxID=506608 RepID=A0A5E4ND00_9HEMI|nr:Hypothetical protein CINCED_3A016271 [Cinara cedri]
MSTGRRAGLRGRRAWDTAFRKQVFGTVCCRGHENAGAPARLRSRISRARSRSRPNGTMLNENNGGFYIGRNRRRSSADTLVVVVVAFAVLDILRPCAHVAITGTRLRSRLATDSDALCRPDCGGARTSTIVAPPLALPPAAATT